MPRSPPLHKVIDAGRWDAEAPLGRLVVIAHAAFLDEGFVPCATPPKRPLPEQVGATASALSLRYTIPELVRRTRAAAGAEAAVLRLCAHGKFVILYGYLDSDGNRPATRWACVDTLFIAPLLSGDLDATAHALASDALGIRLWKALAGGLSRRLFVDICGKNIKRLPPRFMSLPNDLQAAILSRLVGEDLAKVECTCTELRDLVAGRELWKAKYMATRWILFSSLRSDSELDDTSSWSWKEKYVRARLRWPPRLWLWSPQLRLPRWWHDMDGLLLPRLADWSYDYLYQRFVDRLELDRCSRQDPTKHLIERFLERCKVPVGGHDSHRRRRAPHGERRCSKGLVRSPWTHR